MASISDEPQFPHALTPSKVLSVENLPLQCTEEELIELAKPFGEVVNTRSKLGLDMNQALIEFADVNQAIAMISHYASSSEPAQVRGTTVHLQYYSTGRGAFFYNLPNAPTPSKVLWLWNLPWKCTKEELNELAKPFGEVVNIEPNVGAQRNEAFIEFAEQKQATAMILYYISSSKHAQVRGKTFYLEYYNKEKEEETVNNETAEDVALLLVTIEGNDAHLVSIDVLRKVLSAFGSVYEITKSENKDGFQALVQFEDSEDALSAKDGLDGIVIPSYFIPKLGPCSIKITYPADTDSSVKFESHPSSRGYTDNNHAKEAREEPTTNGARGERIRNLTCQAPNRERERVVTW